MSLTKPQRIAVKKIYDRNSDGAGSYYEFRRRAVLGSGCIMLPWCGMWLGIEPDGYTHS